MARNPAEPLRLVVHGATGRMGRVLTQAVEAAPDIVIVGTSSRNGCYAVDSNGVLNLRQGADIDALLADVSADVVVDFSNREAVIPLAESAARHRAHVVTGSSGISDDELKRLDSIATSASIGIMVGPNFSVGAVILENVVARAGRHFDYAEIIEMHHAGKVDAPSGSALAMARAMLRGRDGKDFSHTAAKVQHIDGTRGGEVGGVAIHSVRMPGLMAHQQVILGGPGETLTFRHDVIDRESYMPGVLLTIRETPSRPGLTYGLGALLGLEGD